MANVGQTLGYQNDTWDHSPTSFSYQWFRDGVAISGATGAQYLLVDADLGAMIRVEVVGTNAYGNSAPVASAAIGPIEAAIAPTTSVAHWRVNILAANGGATNYAREIEFKEGIDTADQAVGGTATARGNYFNPPANAFDNDPATFWRDNVDASWIAYQFTANVSVNVITYQCSGATTAPKDFNIESSPDGTTWTIEWSERGITNWLVDEKKTFSRPV